MTPVGFEAFRVMICRGPILLNMIYPFSIIASTYLDTFENCIFRGLIYLYYRLFPIGLKPKIHFPYHMGQQDVLRFLRENPDNWFTSSEISSAIGISKGSVTMSLKRLRESNEVAHRKTNAPGKSYQYKYQE